MKKLMLVAMTVAACGAPEPELHPAAEARTEGIPVVVTGAAVPEIFEAAGQAEPIQRAMLATRLMAQVTAVTVHEGDRVAQGQVLVRLDAAELEARRGQVEAGIAAAEAGWREAKQFADRIRGLYADSAAPRAQLDQAEAGLARAEAGLTSARLAARELGAVREYAELRAPFAGVVTARQADVGAFAAPGMPLVVVEDQSALRISVTAPIEAAGLVRGVELDGMIGGQTTQARVEGVVPAPGGGLLTVNAIVPNPEGRYQSGAAASLAIPMGTVAALTVPVEAVIREGDLTGVRLRTTSGSDLRWVRLGRVIGDRVLVLSGLSAGDTVLVQSGAEF